MVTIGGGSCSPTLCIAVHAGAVSNCLSGSSGRKDARL